MSKQVRPSVGEGGREGGTEGGRDGERERSPASVARLFLPSLGPHAAPPPGHALPASRSRYAMRCWTPSMRLTKPFGLSFAAMRVCRCGYAFLLRAVHPGDTTLL